MRSAALLSTTASSSTPRGAQREAVVLAAVDAHAHALEQLEHRLDVADLRDVVEHDLVLGQDAGGEDGKGGVLVAGRRNRAGQRNAAVDHEFLHSGRRG